MSASARRNDPDAETSGSVGRRGQEEHQDYDRQAGKASNKKSDPFALFKWLWLDQVATDPALPPAAHRIAILIAGRHLNRKLGKAWPGVETLAANLSIKAPNTIRTALKAMEAGGHMFVEWSAGGKNQTNHFYPLVDGKPFKKLKGIENPNPSNSDEETLQNRDAKPFKDLKGNPLMEPSDEPRQTHPASAGGGHTDDNSDARKRASPDPAFLFKVGDEINLTVEARTYTSHVTCAGVDQDGSQVVMAPVEYSVIDEDWIVPIDDAGQVQHHCGWWAKEDQQRTDCIDWNTDAVAQPAPAKSKGRKHHAA